jgi:hypothetical protein
MTRQLLAFTAGMLALCMMFPIVHVLLGPSWKMMASNEAIAVWWVLAVSIGGVSLPLLTCVLLLWLVKVLRKKTTATIEYVPVGCLDSCCLHGDCIPPPPPPRLPVPPPPARKKSQKKQPNKENHNPPAKRNRVANVRAGFSKARKNREYSRPGPKPVANSITNTRADARQIRLTLAIQDKLQLDQCTWHTSKHGGKRKCNSNTTCCYNKMCLREFREQAGGSQEMAAIVSAYRRYYHSLDYDKQRMWWSEHTDFRGYDVVADGGHLRRGHRYHTHWVENIELMRKRLATVNESDVLRPLPSTAFMPVCQNFLLFLIAGNHNTKDQQALRQNVFTGVEPVAPEDLDCNIANMRSPRSPTSDPEGHRQDKTAGVRLWLEHQGSLSLMNPTDNYSVLPYRSCAETHAHYVYEQEASLDKPWAASAFDAMLDSRRKFGVVQEDQHHAENAGNEAQEDSVLRCLGADPSREEEDAEIEREKVRNAKIYRYGNRHCGKLDAGKPEDSKVSSYSHFNKIWRSDDKLNNIICREHLPFVKCDFCIKHRAKAERKRTNEALQADNSALREHLKDVEAEKLHYYSNRARARKWPKDFLSIIIDGADQSKHDMPHFKDMSHLTNELRRIKMHLYGALVHGRDAYAFTITDHEAQGHNSSIQVLHYILVDIAKNGKVPSVLKLQLDNTTKQNKGQYVFAYLSMLIEYGIFENIEVSYLPVGHTHEDIDQFFSRVSVWLRYVCMLSVHVSFCLSVRCCK